MYQPKECITSPVAAGVAEAAAGLIGASAVAGATAAAAAGAPGRGALDVVARVECLLALYDEADTILQAAIDSALSRAELGLAPRDPAALAMEEEEGA